MEKRGSLHSDGQLTLTDQKVSVVEDPPTLRLVLLKAVTMQTVGKVTGRVYVFNGAGSEQDVDVRDAEYLLRRVPEPCNCGGAKPSPYFEIVR